MEKCSKCGELTTNGWLCRECEGEQDQLKEQFKFVELPKREVQDDSEPFNGQPSGFQSDGASKAIRKRAPLDSDTDLLIAIDELIELQKAQNILSKRTADSAGGILAFLILSTLGAFALWFFIAIVLPNS